MTFSYHSPNVEFHSGTVPLRLLSEEIILLNNKLKLLDGFSQSCKLLFRKEEKNSKRRRSETPYNSDCPKNRNVPLTFLAGAKTETGQTVARGTRVLRQLTK